MIMKVVGNIILAMAVAMSIVHQVTTTQQRGRLFNVLVIISTDSRNVSVLQEANKVLVATKTANSKNSSGNWSVKFTEHRLLLSRGPKTTLDFVNNLITNTNLTIDGVIFVKITKDSALLSQTMRNTNIPTMGLQDGGHSKDSLSSELFTYFSRVPTLPLQKIAFVIKDIINRMGWRRICIIETADMEGLKFAQSMVHYAKQEQWRDVTAVLLEGELDDKKVKEIHAEILGNDPDVIIVNNLGQYLHNILPAANTSSSVWILTNHAHLPLDDLPAGVLRVDQRKQDSDYHQHFEVQLLTDAIQFFVSAVNDTVARLCQNARSVSVCGNLLDQSVVRQQVTSYITNDPVLSGDSVFRIPGLYEPPQHAFDLINLRSDQHGHKYWTNIGMWTRAGIALETFINQHGQRTVPQAESPRPLLRVPIVTVPAWMNVGEPYHIGKEKICLSGSPCYSLDPSGNKGTKFCCVGAQVDLINLLANDLKFKAFIYFTPDGKWGGFNSSTGQWTGLMNELRTHKADVTSLLGISKVRNEAVGFTQPYMELGMNILVRKTDTSPKNIVVNWNFLDPFNFDLWLMIVGVTNVFLLVIWGLDRLSPCGHRTRIAALLDNECCPQDDGFTLLDSMSYVWGVAFSKDIGAENTPRSPSARVVSIFFAFMALILVNTYCAKLTAVLMQESFNPPINGIRDEKLVKPSLYPPDGFQLGVVRGSLEEWYFKNHSDRRIQLLYNLNIKINMVNTYKDGFIKLQNKILDGLVGDTVSLQAQANNANCDYRLIGKSFYKFGVSFAFPKGSPWLPKATLSALMHQENGTIERIMKLRFPSKACKNSDVPRFDISDFSGLFMMVVGIAVFAIVVLFAELVLIIMLTKYCGTFMGCLGKKLRFFFLGIRKDENQDIEFRFIFPFGEKSWDLKHSKSTTQNGHRSTRNGLHNGTAMRNYGFSENDLHTDWLNSRVSCRSTTLDYEVNLQEEVPCTQDRTMEAANGGRTNHIQGGSTEDGNT